MELLTDIRGKIPTLIAYESTRALLQENPSPLNVVLLQEIQRYNSVLDTIMYELCVCVCVCVCVSDVFCVSVLLSLGLPI